MNSTGSLGVAVRCSLPPQSTCVDLNPTKGPQLQPPGNYQLSYPNATAIGGDELAALEDVAKANGTWYAGLPVEPERRRRLREERGHLPLHEQRARRARWRRKCCNTSANPGLYILERGTVDFGGNIEFWGVVYNANLDNSSSERLVETSGTSAIRGGVLVDGAGGVYAGSSGDNIVYNAFAFERHQGRRNGRRRPEHLARDRSGRRLADRRRR